MTRADKDWTEKVISDAKKKKKKIKVIVDYANIQ